MVSANKEGYMSDKPHNDKHDEDDRKPRSYQIQIDRVHYTVTDDSMTGAALRTVPEPDISGDRDLFEVVPGNPDRKIELTDQVEIKNGKRFDTAPAHINPGRLKA
jgi:hypothetical protein